MVAIDLGSNTVRAVEFDCERKIVTAEYEKIVKTADMLASTGVIDHKAVDRIIYALREAQQKIDFEGQPVAAVATEALRRAKNKTEVLARIAQETGVRFEVIDGEKEAALTLKAVRFRLSKLHVAARSFVLVDIGGGSTEIVYSYADEKVISKSFPVGIVTAAQRYSDLSALRSALSEMMLPMRMFAAEIHATYGTAERFVATAGTPTTVAAMKLGQTYATYDAKKINGTTLTKSELPIFLERLLRMPPEKREATVGVGRGDLIAAGILIFESLFDIVEHDRCIVVDDGLREGLALQTCEERDVRSR